MKDGFIKVATATPEISVANCPENAREILSCVRRAQADGVQLLVLPELCVTGYTCGDLFMQNDLQQAAGDALEGILRALEGTAMLVVAGAPIRHGQRLYNCAVVIQGGKILGVVPKTYLANYGEFYEKRIFASAPSQASQIMLLGQEAPFGNRLLFCCREMPDFRFGIEICEDLWTAVPPSTFLAAAGATVICNLSASDEAVGKPAQRRMLVTSQSARQICGYLFSSAGEGESTTDVVFSGHEMIAENGSLLAESLPFGAGYAVSELDLAFLVHERMRKTAPAPHESALEIPFSLPPVETKLTRCYWAQPFVADTQEARAERADEIFAIQAHGLKKRITHVGAKKLIIGVSGGLDSTLALLVCKEALRLLARPASDILAFSMPCFGTSDRTRTNTHKLADALGVPLRTVDITASVARHLSDIGHAPDLYDTAFENAQARERTQVLMDSANMEGGLVVGTGDLSELALGFATYGGDHISMYGVNAGVPKTLMRSMIGIFAARAASPLGEVLSDILHTPVSPELLPAKDGDCTQITEDLIGPYELHDFFLYHLLRRGEDREKILRIAVYAFMGAYTSPEIAAWYDVFCRRFFSQQFKRSCLPDGPRVGNVSLSPRGDWRMPSDASAAVFRK